eukprot:6175877-Pleurochrysis_carterae.AAC.2
MLRRPDAIFKLSSARGCEPVSFRKTGKKSNARANHSMTALVQLDCASKPLPATPATQSSENIYDKASTKTLEFQQVLARNPGSRSEAACPRAEHQPLEVRAQGPVQAASITRS